MDLFNNYGALPLLIRILQGLARILLRRWETLSREVAENGKAEKKRKGGLHDRFEGK